MSENTAVLSHQCHSQKIGFVRQTSRHSEEARNKTHESVKTYVYFTFGLEDYFLLPHGRKCIGFSLEHRTCVVPNTEAKRHCIGFRNTSFRHPLNWIVFRADRPQNFCNKFQDKDAIQPVGRASSRTQIPRKARLVHGCNTRAVPHTTVSIDVYVVSAAMSRKSRTDSPD